MSKHISYSEEEANKIEATLFCFVMGGDFVTDGHDYMFTKNEVQILYNKYIKDLIDTVRDGDEKDKKYALDLISGLQINPIRFH